MKGLNKVRLAVLVLVVLSSLLVSSCGVLRGAAEKGTNEYEGLVRAYLQAQEAAANGRNCLVLGYSDITTQMQLANNYMEAEVKRTEAYRNPLAEYGTTITEAAETFEEQNAQYVDENGNPLSANSLDLDKLAESGALPSDMGFTLNVYATSFTEAPLEQLDSEPVLNAQRAVSERYNQIDYCLRAWNKVVTVYNEARGMVSGEVVGTIANELGVRDLPRTLPYANIPGAGTEGGELPEPPSFGD